MEKMLVTQALNELKLLDSRITHETRGAAFVVAAKTSEKKVSPSVTKETFCNDATAKYQSICDLIQRRAKIKAAVVASNAKTEVTIHGVTMTVAAAIEMKTSIDYWVNLERVIKTQYDNALAAANKKNLDLEKSIDSYLVTMFGTEVKNNRDKYLDTINPIREANEYSLVDPIKSTEKLEELRDMISGFQSEVDSVLQISNCTTFIEF
ncbi:MAG: hypothetical protein V8S76_00925 [Lachnospiraceae bacterium]